MTFMKKLGSVVGAMTLAGIVAGVSGNAGASTSDGSAEANDDVQIMVTRSFEQTCTYPYTEQTGNTATFARANSCLKRDNTWSGPTVWYGQCTTNLINNDGRIECSSTP